MPLAIASDGDILKGSAPGTEMQGYPAGPLSFSPQAGFFTFGG